MEISFFPFEIMENLMSFFFSNSLISVLIFGKI